MALLTNLAALGEQPTTFTGRPGVLPDQPQSSPGNLLLSILSVPLDLAFFFSSLFGLILAHWLESGNQTTAASTERPSTSLDQDPAAFSGSGSSLIFTLNCFIINLVSRFIINLHSLFSSLQ